MDIFEQIEKFKKENPQTLDSEINNLVQAVALSCMRSIVENEELNGCGKNAWHTIRESFEVSQIEDKDLLPMNRDQSYILYKKFNDACKNENIEGIKDGLKQFARIHHDSDSSVLTDAAMSGKLNTLRFFVEDSFINTHSTYKNQVNFENTKGEIFGLAFWYKQKEILNYLIMEHNAEFTDEAKLLLKMDTQTHEDFKCDIISMIKHKHLNYILDVTLSEEDKTKPKNKI